MTKEKACSITKELIGERNKVCLASEYYEQSKVDQMLYDNLSDVIWAVFVAASTKEVPDIRIIRPRHIDIKPDDFATYDEFLELVKG